MAHKFHLSLLQLWRHLRVHHRAGHIRLWHRLAHIFPWLFHLFKIFSFSDYIFSRLLINVVVIVQILVFKTILWYLSIPVKLGLIRHGKLLLILCRCKGIYRLGLLHDLVYLHLVSLFWIHQLFILQLRRIKILI